MRKFIPAILLTSFLVLCCAVLPAGAAMASKRSVLSNGIVLLSSEQNTLPIISIEILLAAIKAREDSPGDIAQKRFAAALYPGSPYGRPVEGNEASVKSIPRESLRN